MKLTEFEFDLPKRLIAQMPVSKRDYARLMILDRKTGVITHDYFYNLPKYLKKDDAMVFNDTKVMPVRLFGKKESGGRVEVLLTSPPTPLFISGEGGHRFLGKNIGRASKIFFEHGLEGQIEDNRILFNLNNTELLAYLDKYGQVPYPPYISKQWTVDNEQKYRDRYQTVYAKIPGSAAAPTAGFHFTKRLITQIKKLGITLDFVTLHVGLGTFAPIKTENIEDHKIHSEYYEIPHDLNLENKRVIAVGTTTVRTLESWNLTGKSSGETNIYIYPGFDFRVVDGMVTNFHMPHSSLVLLVSAFAGKELILHAYNEAIRMGYRWGSFGDGMLIL